MSRRQSKYGLHRISKIMFGKGQFNLLTSNFSCAIDTFIYLRLLEKKKLNLPFTVSFNSLTYYGY